MKNLSGAQCRITVGLEMLCQGNQFWMQRAEVVLVIEDACLSRILPRQQGRSRRVAKRVLRIRAIKSDTLRSKLVDIGRLYDCIAIGSQCRTKIITGNEENVVLRFLRGRCDR